MPTTWPSTVGTADADLDARLSDELEILNAAATPGVDAAEELTVRITDDTHVFVTSFTFQAPLFYERHGYAEFARWQDVPRVGEADVHLRKDLPGGRHS